MKQIDTIMAPLTAMQRGAVIILRLSGNVKNIFRFFKPASFYDRVQTFAKYQSAINTLVKDEVLVTYFQAPHSYTGEDVLEIAFHGNPVIVSTAMQDFLACGVRMAEPGEFTRRALTHGRMTLAQAEAVELLISSVSDVGVSRSYDGLLGAVDSGLDSVRNELLSILAEVEASIDFADESEADTTPIYSSTSTILSKLNKMRDGYRASDVAVHGVRVVIAGAPNAGKSTLFNALLGRGRAIVTDEPGTTRDLLDESVVLDGVRFMLTDTAGLRQTSSPAEQEGINRARDSISSADLVIGLFDPSYEINAELYTSLSACGAILVSTKSDLEQHADCKYTFDVTVSAKTGHGMPELRKLIADKVKTILPVVSDAVSILTERQYVESAEAVKELEAMFNANSTLDITAYHLRKAIEALDKTQGVQAAEQTLDIVFSRFCIGK